jgi:hypothetical protein
MNRFAKMLRSLGGGMAELSPSCREASRLQSEALDHRLSLRKRIGLLIHLVLCRWCRRYGKQIRFPRSVGPASEEHGPTISHGLSPQSKKRIKRALHEKQS